MYEGRDGPKRTRLEAFGEMRRRTKHITREDTDEWSGDRARLTQTIFALQRDKDRFTVKEINLMEELILLAHSIGKEDAKA